MFRLSILCMTLCLFACSGASVGDGGGAAPTTPDVALADGLNWGDVDPLGDGAETSSSPDVVEEIGQQPNVVTGLTITPESTLALQLEQGVSQELGLGAALVYSDGSEVAVPGEEIIWTFSDSTIATVNAANVPVATGSSAGQVLIVAIHAGLHAQCSVKHSTQVASCMCGHNVTLSYFNVAYVDICLMMFRTNDNNFCLIIIQF